MSYYENPRLSNSDLSLMKKSINHYLNKKQESTPAMEFGSAFHSLILEPTKFFNEYTVCDLDKRTKEYKEFLKLHEGYKILTKSDWDLLQEMQSVCTTELLNFQDIHEIEKEYYFTFWGFEFKSKLDYINHDQKYIVDLKTSQDLGTYDNDYPVLNTIKNYSYHRQGAIYQMAVNKNLELNYDYYIIFVEKSIPSGMKIVKLTESRLNDGIVEAIEILNRFDNYLETGESGYNKQIINF